ncbi:hypothetical protein [Enterococcus sp. DIV0086]
MAKDKEMIEKRYYPTDTMGRMIRAKYQVMKTFGVQGRKKKN